MALTVEAMLLIISAAQPAFTALGERNRAWPQPILIAATPDFAVLVVGVSLHR